jgi:hypothetical protein
MYDKLYKLVNMKKGLIVLTIQSLISAMPLFSQSGIVVTGQSIELSSGKVSASIGQLDYQSTVVSSGSIQEGIQQSNTITVEIIEMNATDVKVYPNPTDDVLYIDINSEPNITRLVLLSSDGKSIILDTFLNELHNPLSIKTIAPGVYFMQLIQGEMSKQTFKIIKQ